MFHFRLRAGPRTVPEEQYGPHMEAFFPFATYIEFKKKAITIIFQMVGRVVRGNSSFELKEESMGTFNFAQKR
jgi:hypothetical protein